MNLLTRAFTPQQLAKQPIGIYRAWIGTARRLRRTLNGKSPRLRLKMDSRDIRWSQDVKERDGFACVYCGAGRTTGTSVDAAHIVPRRYLVTRRDLLNGLTLCYKHHAWAHAEQSEFMAWVWEQYPERARHLQRLVPTWKGWT